MISSPMARRLRACALLGLAFAAGWSTAASAGPMATGGPTSQPIGHYDFCKTSPAECSIHPGNLAPATMSGALWRKMLSVNA
ncbi:MAG: transglutaminase, partial [Mesorhizobium sp.]